MMTAPNSNPFIRLDRAYRVDEAINTREKHLVIVRFGHESDEACKQVDEWLASEAETFKEDIKIYAVAMSAVPELVARYGLSGPATILFFSDNNLVHYLSDKDEMDEGKMRETVEGLVQKMKMDMDAAATARTPTQPEFTGQNPVDHFSATIYSDRTPISAPRRKWFCWNKSY